MEVSKLRIIIRKNKNNYFNDIKADADQLILWKVEIPTDVMNLVTEIRANDIKKELGGEKLSPFKKACVYFSEQEYLSEGNPTRRNINTIVHLPIVFKKFAMKKYQVWSDHFFILKQVPPSTV
jgi:hypothetical protein